jgi:hypothetical protein
MRLHDLAAMPAAPAGTVRLRRQIPATAIQGLGGDAPVQVPNSMGRESCRPADVGFTCPRPPGPWRQRHHDDDCSAGRSSPGARLGARPGPAGLVGGFDVQVEARRFGFTAGIRVMRLSQAAASRYRRLDAEGPARGDRDRRTPAAALRVRLVPRQNLLQLEVAKLDVCSQSHPQLRLAVPVAASGIPNISMYRVHTGSYSVYTML